jgi:hypothetical protein
MLFVSFVDRDMIMRHFGFGIGHVDSVACEHNNEDHLGSDLDSDLDPDLDSDLTPDSRASDLENMDISNSDSDSDRDSSESHSHCNTSSSNSGSDTEPDDDGYASF